MGFIQSGFSLLLGLGVNFLSLRLKIIGGKTHLPLILSVVFFSILIPEIGIKDILLTLVFVPVFVFFISNIENRENSNQNLIHLGILAGVMQILYAWTVFVFLIFILIGLRHTAYSIRQYVLFLFYFILILFIYTLVVFVLELENEFQDFLPKLNLSFPDFLVTKFYIIIGFLIFGYLLRLNSFQFRYPVKSTILHFSLFFSLIIFAFGGFFGGGNLFYILMSIVLSWQLSTYFYYQTNRKIGKVIFLLFIISVAFWDYFEQLYHYFYQ